MKKRTCVIAFIVWTIVFWGMIAGLQLLWWKTVQSSPQVDGVPDLKMWSHRDIPYAILALLCYVVGAGKISLWHRLEEPKV